MPQMFSYCGPTADVRPPAYRLEERLAEARRTVLATLDTGLSNRGLQFDAELVPFCGKVFRANSCVERFVDEKPGKMRRLKTPAVTLDGSTCKVLFSGQRLLCPRSINLWCRPTYSYTRCPTAIVRPAIDGSTTKSRRLVADERTRCSP
jgi:hypothetical protein